MPISLEFHRKGRETIISRKARKEIEIRECAVIFDLVETSRFCGQLSSGMVKSSMAFSDWLSRLNLISGLISRVILWDSSVVCA